MIIKDGNCEKCEHWVLCGDGTTDRVCEFDGECENMIREQTNEEWIKSASTEELAEFITQIADLCFSCNHSRTLTLQNAQYPCFFATHSAPCFFVVPQ